MSKKFKIGIDYGGTKIEGILLDDNGLQIERKRYSYKKNYLSNVKIFENNFKRSGAGVINCGTEDSYVKKLLGYFKNRS